MRGNYIDAKQLSVTDGNGKRTLDIDSFGNVFLDVTSLNIQSTSVDEFVDNSINSTVNDMLDIFKDGVLTDVEKEVLRLKREELVREREDVTAQARALLSSIDTSTNECANLNTALVNYENLCDVVINKIDIVLGG